MLAKRSFNADSESIRGISMLGMLALSLYYASDESKEGVIAKMDNVSLNIANIRRPD